MLTIPVVNFCHRIHIISMLVVDNLKYFRFCG